jgi:hypothetical protein
MTKMRRTSPLNVQRNHHPPGVDRHVAPKVAVMREDANRAQQRSSALAVRPDRGMNCATLTEKGACGSSKDFLDHVITTD